MDRKAKGHNFGEEKMYCFCIKDRLYSMKIWYTKRELQSKIR